MNIFPVTLEILMANYSLYAGKRASHEVMVELDKLASMIDDPVTSEFIEWNDFELIYKSITPTGAELCMTHLDSKIEESAGVYWLEDCYYLISFRKSADYGRVTVSVLSYYKAPESIGDLSGFSEEFNDGFRIIYADVFA